MVYRRITPRFARRVGLACLNEQRLSPAGAALWKQARSTYESKVSSNQFRVHQACRRDMVEWMESLGELQAQVAMSYDNLGMPCWPNPHPEMTSPREEEYSRVTEPSRYRIVHARARVWVDRLGQIPGVEVEPLGPDLLAREEPLGRFDRGVRLTSSRSSTLPLLLLERDVQSPELATSLAVLYVSVIRPEIDLAVLPDCGCDACDSGSAELLSTIDQTISNVVGGPFVVLWAKKWHALWHPTGSSLSSGRSPVDHDQVREMCRQLAGGEHVRLPRHTEAFVGHSWLD